MQWWYMPKPGEWVRESGDPNDLYAVTRHSKERPQIIYDPSTGHVSARGPKMRSWKRYPDLDTAKAAMTLRYA